MKQTEKRNWNYNFYVTICAKKTTGWLILSGEMKRKDSEDRICKLW